MKKTPLLIAIVPTLIFLAGCSIHPELYVSENPDVIAKNANDELSTSRPIVVSDLIGLTPERNVTNSLKPGSMTKLGIPLKKGGIMMIVQSGSLVPDRELVAAFSPNYTITTMSGRTRFADSVIENKDFRLYAATRGADTILFVWSDKNPPKKKGKAGFDQSCEEFRIRAFSDQIMNHVHSVVIDVKSGNWDYVNAEKTDGEFVVSSRNFDKYSPSQKLEFMRKTYNDLALNIVEKFR